MFFKIKKSFRKKNDRILGKYNQHAHFKNVHVVKFFYKFFFFFDETSSFFSVNIFLFIFLIINFIIILRHNTLNIYENHKKNIRNF